VAPLKVNLSPRNPLLYRVDSVQQRFAAQDAGNYEFGYLLWFAFGEFVNPNGYFPGVSSRLKLDYPNTLSPLGGYG
jgi:hypothetical protein